MLARHPILARFVFYLLIPLCLGGFTVTLLLRQSLPQDKEVYVVDGITGSIQITRDELGVPSISASSDEDAFFAAGFVHAQDRLWQLMYLRRMVQGRLSEVMGPETLRQDIIFRTMSLSSAAEESWNDISDDVKNALTAYSAGINAWIAEVPVLPLEFLLLDEEPEAWTPVDSLAVAKLFAFSLSKNFREELRNITLRKLLSNDQFNSLMYKYPEIDLSITGSVDLEELAELDYFIALQGDLLKAYGFASESPGSNAWALSGGFLSSSVAMLANDPHLTLEVPSRWYAMSLQGGNLDVEGMSLVGLPMIIVGANRNIAWGITNMLADTQDLYNEAVSNSSKDQYIVDGSRLEFETHKEIIEVKGNFPTFLNRRFKPVERTIKSSINGPVINGAEGRPDNPLVLRMTASNQNDTSVEAFYRLNYSDNWESFRLSLKLLVSPALNFIYIDREGNIGYQAAGKIPVRTEHQGLFPIEGAQSNLHWRNYVHFNNMPQAFNPVNGYIINANNKVETTIFPEFLGLEWADSARADRIKQLIEPQRDKQDFTVSDMWNMQVDTIDLSALKLLPYLSEIQTDLVDKEVIELLQDWDGDMSEKSSAATIFFTWMLEFRKLLFTDPFVDASGLDPLPEELTTIIDEVELDVLINILKHDKANWCRAEIQNDQQACLGLLQIALTQALENLKSEFGGDIEDWHWGDAHVATYTHPAFKDTKFGRVAFSLETQSAGSPNTVNVANGSSDPRLVYKQTHGAAFRMVVEMKDTGPELYFSQPVGQSGNVVSGNFSDTLRRFHSQNSNQLVRLRYTKSVSTQTLQPHGHR